MKWFAFEELMPPTGLHILVVSYKDELAVVQWDAKKMADTWSELDMHYDAGSMPRSLSKLCFWMPVSYFNFPQANTDDRDLLVAEDNMLHNLTAEQQDTLQKIVTKTQEQSSYTEQALDEWIPLPCGEGVRRYHLVRELASLFDELLYGPPKPISAPIQQSFPSDMLSVNTPNMVMSFGNFRSSMPTSSTPIKLKRFIIENPMFEGMTHLEISGPDELFSLKRYVCRYCNAVADSMKEYKKQWKGTWYRTYVCLDCKDHTNK